jgi:choline kinase
MSTISQAEASKPLQQKKMQECNRCKAAGFPNQLIGFERIGEDFTTGKISWKLIDENGVEHKHKFVQDLPIEKSAATTSFRRRRVVDISAVTDVVEARKLLASGWEYKTSYPATIANIPHYVLVKRE